MPSINDVVKKNRRRRSSTTKQNLKEVGGKEKDSLYNTKRNLHQRVYQRPQGVVWMKHGEDATPQPHRVDVLPVVNSLPGFLREKNLHEFGMTSDTQAARSV